MRNHILMLFLFAAAGCSGCYSAAVQDMIDRADAAATNAPAQKVTP